MSKKETPIKISLFFSISVHLLLILLLNGNHDKMNEYDNSFVANLGKENPLKVHLSNNKPNDEQITQETKKNNILVVSLHNKLNTANTFKMTVLAQKQKANNSKKDWSTMLADQMVGFEDAKEKYTPCDFKDYPKI